MKDTAANSRHQMKFLRACLDDPSGLPRERWPSPVVFRRWMRRRGFRVAINGIRDMLRFQSDLYLAAASAAAARHLSRTLDDSSAQEAQSPDASDDAAARDQRIADAKQNIQSLVALLRLSHLRQRHAIDPPETKPSVAPPPELKKIWDELRAFAASPYHPSHTLGKARDFVQQCEAALSDSKNEAA